MNVKVQVVANSRDAAIVQAMQRTNGAGVWATRAVPQSKDWAQRGITQDWTVTVRIMDGYTVDVRSDTQKRIDAIMDRTR